MYTKLIVPVVASSDLVIPMPRVCICPKQSGGGGGGT